MFELIQASPFHYFSTRLLHLLLICMRLIPHRHGENRRSAINISPLQPQNPTASGFQATRQRHSKTVVETQMASVQRTCFHIENIVAVAASGMEAAEPEIDRMPSINWQ